MKFFKYFKKVSLVFLPLLMVFFINARTFASGKEKMPDSLQILPSVNLRGSFGQRRAFATVNPKIWSGPMVKYDVHMCGPSKYRINCGGRAYLSVHISLVEGDLCFSIFNEDTQVCVYRIYEQIDERSGDIRYEMKSLGIISDETNYAEMKKEDGYWCITPCSSDGVPLRSWGHTIRPQSPRPNAYDIKYASETVSTVIVSGFDWSIRNVIFLLAGTILK